MKDEIEDYEDYEEHLMYISDSAHEYSDEYYDEYYDEEYADEYDDTNMCDDELLYSDNPDHDWLYTRDDVINEEIVDYEHGIPNPTPRTYYNPKLNNRTVRIINSNPDQQGSWFG